MPKHGSVGRKRFFIFLLFFLSPSLGRYLSGFNVFLIFLFPPSFGWYFSVFECFNTCVSESSFHSYFFHHIDNPWFAMLCWDNTLCFPADEVSFELPVKLASNVKIIRNNLILCIYILSQTKYIFFYSLIQKFNKKKGWKKKKVEKKNFFKMPTIVFQILGSVAKGNATSFYFRPKRRMNTTLKIYYSMFVMASALPSQFQWLSMTLRAFLSSFPGV